MLAYSPTFKTSCEEGVAFEARVIRGISSNPSHVPFTYRYLDLPAVFGMIEASFGSDEVTVRSFNHSCTGVGVIAQESQCHGQRYIIHQQGETQSMFVAGPLVVPNSQQCYVSVITVTDVPTAQPSPTPSPSGPPTGAPTIVSTTSPPTVNPTRLSNILSTWLEIGAITIRSDTFVQVTGKVSTFKKPQVFISLPDHGNAVLYSGYSHVFVWMRSQIPRLTRDLSPFKCESPNLMIVGATIRGGLL